MPCHLFPDGSNLSLTLKEGPEDVTLLGYPLKTQLRLSPLLNLRCTLCFPLHALIQERKDALVFSYPLKSHITATLPATHQGFGQQQWGPSGVTSCTLWHKTAPCVCGYPCSPAHLLCSHPWTPAGGAWGAL